MNRRLIIRMLGALLLIEAAAMIPALLVAFYFGEGDAEPLCFCILINIAAGSLLSFIPRREKNTNLRLKEGFIITALGYLTMQHTASFSGVPPHTGSEEWAFWF